MDPATHKPIIEYFENLNLQCKDFSEDSFFRMDLEEVFGAFKKGINLPCMAVESPEGDTGDTSINASVLGRMFAFTIMAHPQKNNYQDQNEKLDECERIGLKIIARMRHDNSNKESFLYNRLMLDSISWKKHGPLYSEHLYGYRFTGIIKGSESLKLNPDDWNDIDSVC